MSFSLAISDHDDATKTRRSPFSPSIVFEHPSSPLSLRSVGFLGLCFSLALSVARLGKKIAFATLEMQGGSIVLANGAPIAIFTLLQERLALHSDLSWSSRFSPAISFLHMVLCEYMESSTPHIASIISLK